MILLILTLFCCIEALLSSLLMRGDVGDVLGVGQGVPILPGDPGLPGLLGRSGEFTGLVRRGLDFNVMFIAEAFLPWNLTGESLRSTCSLLAVIRQVNFELLIKQTTNALISFLTKLTNTYVNIYRISSYTKFKDLSYYL